MIPIQFEFTKAFMNKYKIFLKCRKKLINMYNIFIKFRIFFINVYLGKPSLIYIYEYFTEFELYTHIGINS